jgi:predicted CopG family antitoxin
MQITIELSHETYEHLRRQAEAKGLSVSEVAEQLLKEAEANRLAAFFDRMRAEGRILPKKPLPPGYQRVYKRIDVQGKPVSECLIEERR